MFKPSDKLSKNQVIHEILSTEKTYNQAVTLLNETFTKVVLGQSSDQLLGLKESIAQLKDISDALLENVETALVTEIELDRRNTLKAQRSQLLQDFFKVYESFPNQYSTYLQWCSQYEGQVQLLESFVKERNGESKLKLSDYLIQPLQRGVRYSLLVKELIKTSEGLPEDNIAEFQAWEQLVKNSLQKANEATKVTPAPQKPYSYRLGDISRYLFSGIFTSNPETRESAERYHFGDITRKLLAKLWGTTDQPAIETQDETSFEQLGSSLK